MRLPDESSGSVRSPDESPRRDRLTTTALARRDPGIRQKLGPHWFANFPDTAWHAVHGRYDASADRYMQAAHYVGHVGTGFRLQAVPADSLRVLRYGRALALASARLPVAVRASGARFNVLVRPLPDSTLEVWTLPAWQPDGWLLYGIEARYRVDPIARRVLDSSLVVEELRGSQPDSTLALTIGNDTRELPTVGQTFFMPYYGQHLQLVRVRSRDFRSMYHEDGGGDSRMHTLREDRSGNSARIRSSP